MTNPQVWYMVKEAAENLTGELAYDDIKDYINSRWADVNPKTINAQIIVATVNHRSRIHYNENANPRLSNSGSHFDLFYSTARGRVVKYDYIKHGLWELFKDENDKINLRFIGSNTYLFAWNPENWEFTEIGQLIENIQATGKCTVIWSIASYRKAKIGDRAFIMMVGTKSNGLFASGYIISEPQLLPHWSGADKLVHRVTLELDVLLNPNNDEILSHQILKDEVSAIQRWEPQTSGIQIRNEITYQLEMAWFNFLTSKGMFNEVDVWEGSLIEGRSHSVIQTIYERNRYARQLCLQHHGYVCKVCDFDFFEFYGEIGRQFIHVHHLTLLSSVGEAHLTNPLVDLVPVCPNCHAMLHKNNPPFTVQELKEMIKLSAVSSTTNHMIPLSS